MMAPRVNVSRDEIADVVAVFYARVRKDAVLGPVFAEHIEDWPEHEEKIVRFWASALLFEGSYAGNPMRAHMQAGNVVPEHFHTWLSLFDEVLKSKIASPQRDEWSALVHRIGQGLSFGLADAQRPAGVVPHLS